MDRFVVRTPREPRAPRNEAPEPPRLRQLKVKDMVGSGRVVVIEDILRHKAVLKAGADAPAMSASLAALDALRVPVNTLVETRVGVYVRRATSHADADVASKASHLLKKWTDIVNAPPRPRIEVELAGPKARVRRRYCDLIVTALRRHSQPPADEDAFLRIARALDKDVARARGPVSRAYHYRLREIVVALRRNARLCAALVSARLRPDAVSSLSGHSLSLWRPPPAEDAASPVAAE